MRSATFQASLLGDRKEDTTEVPFDPAERWSIPSEPIAPATAASRRMMH
jgi:hypothetical protein